MPEVTLQKSISRPVQISQLTRTLVTDACDGRGWQAFVEKTCEQYFIMTERKGGFAEAGLERIQLRLQPISY